MRIQELKGAAELARQLRDAVRDAVHDENHERLVQLASQGASDYPPLSAKRCLAGSIDAALLTVVDGIDGLVLHLEGK